MKIRKRNGAVEEYRREKIERVIRLAFESAGIMDACAETGRLAADIEGTLLGNGEEVVAVESIQDQVEAALMVAGYYEAAKNFILYRNERSRARAAREQLLGHFADRAELESVLKELQQEFPEEEYALPQLTARFRSFSKSGQSDEAGLGCLIKAAAELTTRDAPNWEMVAARFWLLRFRAQLVRHEAEAGITSLYDKLTHLSKEGVYGSYILAHYTRNEINTCAGMLRPERDKLFNYSGLELLHGR
ncbi:MAG: ATP cone domain-containing protein, partial [Akkermansia sp.]|nr:ATP cone domain-containing protein [Akkermansia sp.]